AYEEDFSDCDAAERIIHERLDAHRFNQDREFFRIPVKDAIRAVAALAGEFQKRDQLTAEAALRAAEAAAAEMAANNRPVNPPPAKLRQWGVSPPGVPIVIASEVACPRCSTRYTITLKRGEFQAACPSCRSIATLAIKW